LMDKPFMQNYDECLRYFAKSYDYAVPFGTGNAASGRIGFICPVGFAQYPMGTEVFSTPLAKIPTVTIYSDVTAAMNTCRDQNAGADKTVSSSIFNTRRINQLSLGAAATAGGVVTFHYAADTGW